MSKLLVTSIGESLSDVKFQLTDPTGTNSGKLIREYSGHKLIMAMNSEYFRKEFENNKSYFEFTNITHNAFEYVLNSMYNFFKEHNDNNNNNNNNNHNNTTLNCTNFADIWNAVTMFKVNPLQKRCVEFLSNIVQNIVNNSNNNNNNGNNNIATAFDKFAHIVNSLQRTKRLFKDGICSLLLGNVQIAGYLNKRFFDDPRLVNIDPSMVALLIQSDELNISEENLWNYCQQYCQHYCHRLNSGNNNNNGNNGQFRWEDLMKQHFVDKIRFPLMDSQYFANHVRGCGVLTAQQTFDIYDCKYLQKKDCCFSNKPRKYQILRKQNDVKMEN